MSFFVFQKLGISTYLSLIKHEGLYKRQINVLLNNRIIIFKALVR
jgi:hypothetical protein